MFYYMDLIIKIDILFVIGVDKCFYRKYEQLCLYFLEYQFISVRECWEENQNIEGFEKEIGDNIVNVVNCFLDCISKVEMDMKQVIGEQLQRVLNFVFKQCDEVLRRIVFFRLLFVYLCLLELIDVGLGVGVFSVEFRI